MKKIMTIATVALLGISLFTGCGADTNKSSNNQTTVTSETDNTQKDSNLFAKLTNSYGGRALDYAERLDIQDYKEQHQKVADLLNNLDLKKGVAIELRQDTEFVAPAGNSNSFTSLIYIGELTPDRRPTGWGIIYDTIEKEPRFVGEFNQGHLSGYGIASFISNTGTRIAEGSFNDSKQYLGIMYFMNAKGVNEAAKGKMVSIEPKNMMASSADQFMPELFELDDEMVVRYDKNHKRLDISIPENKYITYDSEGREIFKADSITAAPKKDNFYHTKSKDYIIKGKGQEYYDNGQIKYKGDYIVETSTGHFMNSVLERHGQGISYNQDGSIEYQGEWIHGEIK